MALKFYTSVTKVLKLEAKKSWRLVRRFVEVAREKLVSGGKGGGGVIFAS